MKILALLILMLPGNAFVVDAGTSTTYTLDIPREALRGYVDDIGLFVRNMPGVVEARPLGDGSFLYRTEKELPLAGTMQTDFLIGRRVEGDSVTVYESVNRADPNYMYCRVLILPAGEGVTSIRIDLALRLTRESGSDVHWLAPILGASFISDKMTKDLEAMLSEFVVRSTEELYERLRPDHAGR